MANTHIELSKAKKDNLKALKKQDQRSINWHINRAIDNYLRIKKAGSSE